MQSPKPTQPVQQPSLKEFIPRNPKNIVFVTDAKQVDDKSKNVKFVGQDWCGFSQLGISQFASVCSDLKEGEKCYLFDLGNPESKKAAEKLKLVPKAYPNHVIVGKTA